MHVASLVSFPPTPPHSCSKFASRQTMCVRIHSRCDNCCLYFEFFLFTWSFRFSMGVFITVFNSHSCATVPKMFRKVSLSRTLLVTFLTTNECMEHVGAQVIFSSCVWGFRGRNIVCHVRRHLRNRVKYTSMLEAFLRHLVSNSAKKPVTNRCCKKRLKGMREIMGSMSLGSLWIPKRAPNIKQMEEEGLDFFSAPRETRWAPTVPKAIKRLGDHLEYLGRPMPQGRKSREKNAPRLLFMIFLVTFC